MVYRAFSRRLYLYPILLLYLARSCEVEEDGVDLPSSYVNWHPV